jgi:hypothetical protein
MSDYERGWREAIERAKAFVEDRIPDSVEEIDTYFFTRLCDGIGSLTPPSPPSVPSATCAMCDRLRAAARDAAARLNTIGDMATTDAAQIFAAVGEDPVIPPCKTCGDTKTVADAWRPCPDCADCAPASVATARGEAIDIAPEGTDNALPTERAKAESPTDAKAATCDVCCGFQYKHRTCPACRGSGVRR